MTHTLRKTPCHGVMHHAFRHDPGQTSRGVRLFCLLLLLAFAGCRSHYPHPDEARGLWLTRWEYTTKLNSTKPGVQQTRIVEAMDLAVEHKLNFILFQVRGQCDAFYRSRYEPWAKALTGTLGTDPGWDPLAFAVKAAHQRKLELHVWINTFTCWKKTVPPGHSNPPHIYYTHPEWRCVDSAGDPMTLNPHYLFLSPGIPAVQEHVLNVVLDIAAHYDIDGIHFDYIRYPDHADNLGYSRDSISLARFREKASNPEGLGWADWQREQINQFVRSVHARVKLRKPWVKLSAAVIGRYDWSSYNGRNVVFQDAPCWTAEGLLDFITPMIYWSRDNSESPFERSAQTWIHRYSGKSRVYPGIGVYKWDYPDWPANEIQRQIETVRRLGGKGMVFFNFTAFEAWSRHNARQLNHLF